MCDTVCLLNMKGGVGKTTLAANLAWHTSRHGKRVLLVDFDPQFNASQYLMDYENYKGHVKTKGTIADLLIDSPQLRLRKAPKKKSAKSPIARIEDDSDGQGGFLDLLPAELGLSHVVKNPAQMDFRLEGLLAQLRNSYDYIFIDSAPTDSVLTTMALTASDFVLIPVRPDRYSLLGVANLLKTVSHFRENCNDPHKVKELGVVFTQIRKGSGVENEVMNELSVEAKHAKAYVFDGVLGYSPTFIRAVRDQTPAFDTKFAREPLKKNIAKIVVEMESRIRAIRGAAVPKERK